MRFDVHKVRVHLVEQLMETPHVREVWHDGTDVVILDFESGESVSIHMVERYISIDEMQYIFSQNARQGYYTLLILWGDMFMPSDGQIYEPNDWMFALLQLYGGKIYAYDAWRHAPFVFQVRFHRIGESRKYRVEHVDDISIGRIGTETIETTFSFFNGFWRVARFDGYATDDETAYWENVEQPDGRRTSVRYYFNLLGINTNADRDQVKQAYRDLARKHHPDLNPAEDTTQRMQKINDAYAHILRYMDSETND